MKKLLVLLLIVLVLAGCSTKGYAKLSNGEDIIFSTPNGNLTKNDLFKTLKYAGETAVKNDLIIKVGTALGFDFTEADEAAQEAYDYYIQMNYESAIIMNYGSKEGFFQDCEATAVLSEYSKDYVKEHLSEYAETDKPVRLQLAYFSDIESANKLIELVNTGSTFDVASTEAGYSYSVTPSIYIDSDNLPLSVKNYINETDSLGISTVITETTTTTDSEGNNVDTNTYYVINVVSRNYSDFEEDYITLKSYDLDETIAINTLFKKAKIEFYDQDVYQMMYSQYEGLK